MFYNGFCFQINETIAKLAKTSPRRFSEPERFFGFFVFLHVLEGFCFLLKGFFCFLQGFVMVLVVWVPKPLCA